MQIDERTARLIAVGASVAANCEPCLGASLKRALDAGADQAEIADAIAVGRLVRKGAASNMDAFLSQLESSPVPMTTAVTCDCSS